MPQLPHLVDGRSRAWGRLDARPATANPLDEFPPLLRPLRRLRLKEWIGFTLLHPDWYSSLIVQDAHYLASSEMYAYERASGELAEHAANARGGSPALPAELLGADCAFRRPGHRVEYEFAAGAGVHRLRVDIDATASAPAIRGQLELDAGRGSSPLSVSSRLPAGGRMYTHKAVFPASGELRVGDRTVVFDPSRDLALLDEHRSLLPHRTRWVWGTFALPGADGPVGANFVRRPELPGEPEESCLWSPGGCEPLSDVAFHRLGRDASAPWEMRSADGRLDVRFEPEGRKRVHHDFGLLAIDYFQLFGRYAGTVRTAAGPVSVDGAHGVCESMNARM